MLDLFIGVVFVWAIYSGWRNGLIKELAAGTGVLVGLLIAATCYNNFGEQLAVHKHPESNGAVKVFAFFLLWIVTPLLLGLAANLFTKVLDRLHVGGINRAFGALLSVVKFTILLSCLLSVMSLLGILNQERTAESRLYEPVKGLVGGFVHWAIGDDLPAMPHVDSPAFTDSDTDTVWIDVPKRD